MKTLFMRENLDIPSSSYDWAPSTDAPLKVVFSKLKKYLAFGSNSQSYEANGLF